MTKRPSLSIIIPTHDPTRPLARCLLSIAKQIAVDDDGIEVLVIVDTKDMTVGMYSEIEAKVNWFGGRFRCFSAHSKEHTWGHDEINFGQGIASKDYIVCNDDDDIFTQGALNAIRDEIEKLPEPMPLLFRWMPFLLSYPLWAEKQLVRGRIGGHCLVQPNIKDKLAFYPSNYTGDFDWIVNSVKKWGGMVKWAEAVIAIARPTPNEWPERWK